MREITGKQREVVERNRDQFMAIRRELAGVRRTLSELQDLLCEEGEAIDFDTLEIGPEEEVELRAQARQHGVSPEVMRDHLERHGPPPSGPQAVEDDDEDTG